MRARRQTREPTIALINIVFLMLVFFMVAGTLAPPLERDLSLVRTDDLEGRAPPDALVIRADGEMLYRGTAQVDVAAYVEGLDPEAREEVRIVPDRDLPAADLVTLGRELRRAGAGRVIIVTERALQ
ncbi:biopolymer transporter ExbD [Tateyamaria sp. syn59]|uniref:ExbD/TolR family protein n=1 Tax=Tateyamaria sp. syn59 TaxID=2576942 RepID=UPI0011BD9D08|nr:biopolymer transporter ExbD [Tateyamaria sp. syn59]